MPSKCCPAASTPGCLSLTRNWLSVQTRIAYRRITGGKTYPKNIPKFVVPTCGITRRTSEIPTNPPANKRSSKRHRAAALQDAVAPDCTLLLPRGLGVRQPYAAFVAWVPQRYVRRFHAALSSVVLLASAATHRTYRSAVLLSFTVSREVSFGGKRMLLAATFPHSMQSIR
jgi:hypothetical protein